MDSLKNYIIQDPYSPLVDLDAGSPFREALEAKGIKDYAVLAVGTAGPDEAECASAVRKAIGAETAAGRLRNYVILTDRPGAWRDGFIPNNVIDVRGKAPEKAAEEAAWVFSGFGRGPSDGGRTFFTSDTHFFHKAIIGYCDRPWRSGRDEYGNPVATDEDVVRMNEDMVRLWNETVGKDDVVWHLGDFCLGRRENFDWLFPVEERDADGNPTRRSSRLNGRINLVLGNHDRRKYDFYRSLPFHRVYDRPVLLDDFIVLSHEPMQFVKAPWFNIAGHVHSTGMFRTFSEHGCIVCVERHGYRPVSLTEIRRGYEKATKEGEAK